MRLAVDAARIELSVRDTGSALPPEFAQQLFHAPVPRAGGMGIGLYNVSRMATEAGYELRLAANTTGEVCFALSRNR